MTKTILFVFFETLLINYFILFTTAAAAIRCRPLLSHVVNSSHQHVGAVVSASCPDMKSWHDDRQPDSIVTVCDQLGRWQPAVPACVRK